MRTSVVLSLGTLAAAQSFQSARVISNNRAGVSYVATLTPREGAAFPIVGTVVGTSATDGTGVDFAVSVDGFDSTQGPFAYHIHDQPVPSDGNCSGTLAHLDPTRRGQQPPCDRADISKCEVGDLSGKYGTISTDSFSASYHDDFTSTTPGLIEFFGNRSITFHLPNSTRIACANFTLASAGDDGSSTGIVPYPTGGSPYPTGGSGSGNGSAPYPTGGEQPTGGESTPTEGVPTGPSASGALPGETSPATASAIGLKSDLAGVLILAGLAALVI